MKTIVRSILAAAFTAALLATPANAKQVFPYHYDSSFDGTGSTGGKFSTNGGHAVAVNDSNGNVYVADSTATACPGPGRIVSQFDATGQPVAFSALEGRSSLCAIPGGGGV